MAAKIIILKQLEKLRDGFFGAPWYVYVAFGLFCSGLVALNMIFPFALERGDEQTFMCLRLAAEILLVGAAVWIFTKIARDPVFRFLASSLVDKLLLVLLVLTAIGVSSVPAIFSDVGSRFSAGMLGSMLGMVTGMVSLLGVYVTYRSVSGFKSAISSFEDLMAAATEVLNEGGASKIVAYTPLVGGLSMPKDSGFKAYKRALEDRGSKIEVVCLDVDELAAWHNGFAAKWKDRRRSPITVEDAQRASRESEFLLENVIAEGGTVRRFTLERLPRYYLFANESRVVFAFPLFLPSQELAGQENGGFHEVEMLGFDTRDRRLIAVAEEVVASFQQS